MIRILYFGQCEEITGKRDEEMDFAGSAEDLRELLLGKYSALSRIDWQIAVNRTLGTKEIIAGDEVALLPPFAGG